MILACIRNAAILVLLAFCAGSTLAAELRPPPSDGPLPVTVLVYVLDLSSIDSAGQQFTASVFLRYDWTDSRLEHDGDGPVLRGGHEIWHPHMQILNQQRLHPTFPEQFEIFPDGRVRYRQRVWGNFSQPMDLRDYPMDEQRINIRLIATGLSPDQVRLVPSDEAVPAISPELSIADFVITDSEQVAEPWQPMGSNRSIATIRSSHFARRNIGYFLVKVILPLMLIVMMSWSAFWIDPAQPGIQMSVATTSMLTLIAYRFAVGAGLPKISYLTRLDTFIMLSTVLVALTLFEVVLTSRLASTGRIDRAVQIDRWARVLFPTAYVIVGLLSFRG